MYPHRLLLLPRKPNLLDTSTRLSQPADCSPHQRCPLCLCLLTSTQHNLCFRFCGHTICTQCLVMWLDAFRTCPVCERQVYRGAVDEHSFIAELRALNEGGSGRARMRMREQALEERLRLGNQATFLETGLLNVVVLDDEGGGKNCPICLEDMIPLSRMEVGVIVICGHAFHIFCLRRWLWEKNTCPVCRKRLFRSERQRTIFDEVERNPYYVLQLGDTRELEWVGFLMQRLIQERVRVFVERGGDLESIGRDERSG